MRWFSFPLIALVFATASAQEVKDFGKDRLNSSPRHGEWVDLKSGDRTIKAFVVYPERKDKAPVVIVIHEIFGLTDWVRSVADALAAEGFIAVAPDMLSGQGPDGGNSESFKGDDVRAAIQKLTPTQIMQMLN